MAYFPGPTKVLFDIQEEYLVVYPATELYIEGSEDKWKKEKVRNYWDEGKSDEFVEMYVGEPVAIFEIISHFDVIRKYNAQTGEQSNVIVEDEDDNYWYEREYIRVNWGANKLTDLMFMSGTSASSVDYYVQEYEEDNPDAFELTDTSLNFVSKMFLEPDSPDSCSIYMVAPSDCVGVVAKVRHSFRKVDPNNDYVPLYYGPDKWMGKFGFFLTERYGYNEDHGLLYSNRVSYIQRWNIWDNSRNVEPLVDDEGNQVACMADMDCEGLHEGQVHCWLDAGWFSGGHCVTWDPLPLHEREPRPIKYWISSNWPEELKASNYETAEQWNVAFKESVAWGQFYSEKDMYDVKYCDTNEDCKPEGVLLDQEYRHDHPRSCDPSAAQPDAVCKEDLPEGVSPDYQKCSVDGACMSPIPCDKNAPCLDGQMCMSGVCHQCGKKDGDCAAASVADWEKVITTTMDKDTYSLYYANAAAGDSVEFKRGIDSDFTWLGQYQIRIGLAHLAPGIGPVSLVWDFIAPQFLEHDGIEYSLTELVGISCQGEDGYNLAFEYQDKELFATPTCTISLPWVKLEDEDGEQYDVVLADELVVNLKVLDKETGAPLAVSNFTVLRGRTVHSLALVESGDKPVLIHGEANPDDVLHSAGMRLVHAAPGREAIDLGVMGALTGDNVSFGEFSPYARLAYEENRVVVQPAGTPGDITCFHDKGIGRCTGWRPKLAKTDMERYQEIMEGLPEMFVACENAYTGDLCDPAEYSEDPDERRKHFSDCRYWQKNAAGEWFNPCQVPGAAALKKHGDLRYSSFYWIPEDQSSSPLGYGPNGADPDTGEVYYGIGNIYGGPMISYGQYATDLLAAARGELKKGNIMTADYIRDYLESKGNPSTYESLYAPLPDSKRQERLRQVRPPVERYWLTPEERHEFELLKQDPDFMKDITDPQAVKKQMLDSVPSTMSEAQLGARFEKAGGTWLEDLMTTSEVELAGTHGDLHETVDGSAAWDALSPMNWASPKALKKQQERLKKLAENNYYAQDMVEPNVLHTAIKVEEWCADPENLKAAGWDEYDWNEAECQAWRMTKLMLDGVLEHEIGHTIGLRHVFNASTDVFNYQDEYYKIREKDYRKCYLAGKDGCLYGDYCVIKCKSDANCMPGTVCELMPVEGEEDPMGTCVNEHFDPTGWCWGERTEFIDCQADGQCDAAGEEARCRITPEETWGICEAPVVPNDAKHCPSGTLSVAGSCQKDDFCAGAAKDKPGKCSLDASISCTDDAQCKVVYAPITASPTIPSGKEFWADAEDLFFNETLDDFVDHRPFKSFNPRATQTQKEIDEGRSEYQYSTLMDYGGTVNFDTKGIGKYDRAAIRFGYAELVDVYVDQERMYAEVEDLESLWGDKYSWSNLYMDTEMYSDHFWHSHFFFLTDFLGVKENFDRIPVPFRKADLEKTMLNSDYRGMYDLSYRIVPYNNSYDMWRGNLEIYVWDLGADLGEIIDHSWNKLVEYYIYDAFKRERWGAYRGFDPLGYYNRILSRWFPPIEDAGRFMAFYTYAYRGYGSFSKIMFGNVNWFGRFETYARDSLQNLSKLVFSPTPGSYQLVDEGTEEERYVNFSYDAEVPGSEFDVNVGAGKFPYTTFYDEAGYYYFEHPAFIGSFWEKLAAAHTMTYGMGYWIGSAIAEQDSGLLIGSSAGFNTNYYTELTNMLAGFIIGDRSRYAPYIEEGELHHFDPLHPWEAAGMPRLETSIETLAMKAYLAMFGYSYMPSAFDSGFLDTLRICLKGSGSCYTHAGAEEFGGNENHVVDAVEFVDPWSKKTYLAWTTNYDPQRIDAAYELLTKANELKAEWEVLEWGESEETDIQKTALGLRLSEMGETLDLLMTYNTLYGTALF